MNYKIVDDRCSENVILLTDLEEGQFGVDKNKCLWLRTDNCFLAFEDNLATEYSGRGLDEEFVTPVNVTLTINK